MARNHGASDNDLVTDAHFALVPRHGYRLKSQNISRRSEHESARNSPSAARNAAMPALDQGRGWRAFRVIENDPQGVAIDADNFKDRTRDRRLGDLRGF